MTFLEKLDYLMNTKSLNKRKLSELSGIPYTTIVNLYVRSYEKMQLSTFKRLCEYFGVTMDCMARDEITEIEYYNPDKKDLHITNEEAFLISCYRSSDSLDKELALRALKADEKGDGEKMA